MKFMLTIQHECQKVAYIEFKADNILKALEVGESLFVEYKTQKNFIQKQPYVSGNFSGYKPPIKSHHVSKWVGDTNATNALGQPSGGYWKNI